MTEPRRPPVAAEDERRAREILARHGLDPATPMVAASPGAPRPAERWAPERFAEVLRALRQRHGWNVVIVGSDRERALCEAVRCAVGGECANLAGETGIHDLAALLGWCRLLVSNATETLDLGVAMGIPAVGILGPPAAPAPGRAAGFRAVYHPVECRPCGRTRCGHHTCMRLLTVGAVLSQCESALRGAARLQGLAGQVGPRTEGAEDARQRPHSPLRGDTRGRQRGK